MAFEKLNNVYEIYLVAVMLYYFSLAMLCYAMLCYVVMLFCVEFNVGTLVLNHNTL